MRKMNILIISRPIVPPWDEGSKNTAWQIATHARQHRFLLLTTRSEHPPPVGEQVSWEYIYTNADFTSSQRLRLLWYLLRGRRDVDIYHSIFVPTPATSRILSRATRLRRKPSVQTVISLYTPNLEPAKARELFFADRVVAISDHTADRLNELEIQNVIRINLGVDTTCYASDATARQAARETLGIPPDTVVVLFAGEYSRLGSGKILPPVIARSLRAQPDLYFLLACRNFSPLDERMETSIRHFVQSQGLERSVRFLGKVENFPALLRASDVLLYPVSSMVGKVDTPLTVLEAMATGLPIVITDIAPLNEVFQPDVGRMVAVGNNEELVRAMLDLSADPESRHRMGLAAQAATRARYKVHRMAQAYEELYAELYETTGRPR